MDDKYGYVVLRLESRSMYEDYGIKCPYPDRLSISDVDSNNYNVEYGKTFVSKEIFVKRNKTLPFYACVLDLERTFAFHNDMKEHYIFGVVEVGEFEHGADFSKTNRIKLLKTFYKEEIPTFFREFTNGTYTSPYGYVFTVKDGYVHSENDMPAVIRANGDKAWYQYGLKHRDNDLPAVIDINGGRIWYQHGIQCRKNGPAMIMPSR